MTCALTIIQTVIGWAEIVEACAARIVAISQIADDEDLQIHLKESEDRKSQHKYKNHEFVTLLVILGSTIDLFNKRRLLC